ncbi:phage coat protein, partial [Acinetobacter baumannii]
MGELKTVQSQPQTKRLPLAVVVTGASA